MNILTGAIFLSNPPNRKIAKKFAINNMSKKVDVSLTSNSHQVLEIRPSAADHLPIGARVCTLWSSALAQLFPGTITAPDEPLPEGHVLVELDDGDSRLVEMTKIRMLPSNYSRVGE